MLMLMVGVVGMMIRTKDKKGKVRLFRGQLDTVQCSLTLRRSTAALADTRHWSTCGRTPHLCRPQIVFDNLLEYDNLVAACEKVLS